MARSRNKIIKERALRKRVRREKARLRRRTHKHKRTQYIIIHINGLELEKINKLRELAKQRHCSINTLITRLLTKAMREQDNGI